MSSLIFRIVTA